MAPFGHRSIIVCSSSSVSLKSSSLYFLSLHGMYVDITNSLIFLRNVSSNCNSNPTLRVVFATVCPRIGSGCPALFHASSAVFERTMPTPPLTCGFPSSFFFPFEKNRIPLSLSVSVSSMFSQVSCVRIIVGVLSCCLIQFRMRSSLSRCPPPYPCTLKLRIWMRFHCCCCCFDVDFRLRRFLFLLLLLPRSLRSGRFRSSWWFGLSRVGCRLSSDPRVLDFYLLSFCGCETPSSSSKMSHTVSFLTLFENFILAIS